MPEGGAATGAHAVDGAEAWGGEVRYTRTAYGASPHAAAASHGGVSACHATGMAVASQIVVLVLFMRVAMLCCGSCQSLLLMVGFCCQSAVHPHGCGECRVCVSQRNRRVRFTPTGVGNA